MASKGSPIRVFALYAQEDEEQFRALSKHLMPLQRLGLIELGAVEAGQSTEDQLDGKQILLLLVSDNLLGSEASYLLIEKAMERQRSGTRVIPILIGAADFRGLPFEKLAPLPRNGKPVSQWAQRDAALFEVTQGIRQVVEALERQGQVAPQSAPAAPPPARAATGPTRGPTRASLRKLLSVVLVGDADLEAFCGDFFPEIRRRFGSSMDRMAKVTLLLDYASLEAVLRHLDEEYPEAMSGNRHLLRFE